MRERWDYRSVEGLLYRLGQPPEARPARGSTERRPHSRPSSHPPSAPFLDARVDVDIAVHRALDEDEATDLRDHYVLGVRRHGYKRRSAIIKKLVSDLNGATEIDD